MIIEVETNKKSGPIEPENISEHKVPLGKMTLGIYTAWGISLELKFEGNRGCVIESWSGEEDDAMEQAEKMYDEVMDKLKKSVYTLHLYDDGSVEIEF